MVSFGKMNFSYKEMIKRLAQVPFHYPRGKTASDIIHLKAKFHLDTKVEDIKSKCNIG